MTDPSIASGPPAPGGSSERPVARRAAAPSRRQHAVASALAARHSTFALAYALAPLSLGVIWVLRSAGLIADSPLALYAALLFGPAVLSALTNANYARRRTTSALHLRAANDALATTLIIYATGWGPVIVVVYLFAAQQLVAASRPSTWRISVRWACAGIAVGQLGIAVGWVPSFVPWPMNNGAAALGVVALLLVAKMAATAAAEREHALDQVRASEERFRSLVKNSSDLIMVVDEGRALYVSGASDRMLGLTGEEVRRLDLHSLIHPGDLDRVQAVFDAGRERSEPIGPIELRAQHSGGQWRDLEVVGTSMYDDPAVGGLVLNVRDITDRKRAEHELLFQATHDSLTGLPNRRLLIDRLGHALTKSARDGSRVAVIVLGLDRFKVINDGRGHPVGDQLLSDVASRLRRIVRACDTVARVGGDEYVVVIDGVADGDEAKAAARRIAWALDAPFQIAHAEFFLSASQGIAVATAGESPEEVLAQANDAMYRAKERGRSRAEFAGDAAAPSAVSRLDIELGLRRALDNDQFVLHYQPVVDLATGAIVGAEALLRWNHPTEGLLPPSEFVPIAEQSGLIVPIGDWVVNRALCDATGWVGPDGRPVQLSVAVNVAGAHLAAPNLPFTVARAIRTTGIDPSRVHIEITETVLIENLQRCGEVLTALRGIGVHVDVDDFGTGYSSLAYVQELPVDSLKIDRTFVDRLDHGDRDDSIVTAVLGLGRALRLDVIAEGVETGAQQDALARLGCTLAQGYRFARPAPAADFERLIRDGGMTHPHDDVSDDRPRSTGWPGRTTETTDLGGCGR